VHYPTVQRYSSYKSDNNYHLRKKKYIAGIVSRSRRILQTKLFQGAMYNVHFTISVDVTALNVSNTIRRQKLCNIRSKMALSMHLLVGNRVLAVFEQLPLVVG